MPPKTPPRAVLRRLLAVCALACALGTFPAAPAAQWKWRGTDGQMHYGDQPPPGAQRLRLGDDGAARPAAAASAAAAAASARALRRRLEAAQRASAAAQTWQREAASLQRARLCAQARARLQQLDSGRRLIERDAQGQRSFVGDAQRAELRAGAQAGVAAYCGG